MRIQLLGRLSGILLTALYLTACGGGGGGGAGMASSSIPPPSGSPPSGGSPPASSGAGTATFSIQIPLSKTSPGSSLRRPSYVSFSTQSIAVFVNHSSKPSLVADLTISSPNCTNFIRFFSCQVSFSVPAGNDTLDVRLYDGAKGTGSVLSHGITPVAVQANATTNVSLVLNAVIHLLAINSVFLTLGQAATASVDVFGVDADGNAVGYPGLWEDSSLTPVTSVSFTDSDKTGVTVLETTSAAVQQTPFGAEASVLLDYTGAALPGGATITATANSNLVQPGTTVVTPQ